jgi:hypothetical protein
LLPHRRSAWIRFAERCDELADFADTLDSPAAPNVLPDVAAALRALTVRFLAHVEAV